MIKWQDALAVVAMLIALAALVPESEIAVGIMLATSCVLMLTVMFVHSEMNLYVRILSPIAVIVVSLFIFSNLHSTNQEKEFLAYGGVLYPASDKKQNTICPAIYKKNGYFVRFNGNDFLATSKGYNVLSINGKSVLSFKKDVKAIRLSNLMLYDRDGDNIANFTDGRYWISPVVRKERRTISDLFIFDKKGSLNLEVNYISANEIEVRGLFRDEDGHTAIKYTSNFTDNCAIGGSASTGINVQTRHP